jgi:hypothetical protein
MKVGRLILGIFFALGVGLLIGSYFTVRHTRHFLQVAVSAPGVVVENVLRESSNSRNEVSWSYYPRIHFQTAENLQIDFMGGTGSNPPSYSVNEPVTVLYDPQQPYNASLNSFFSLWGATIVLVILGVAFTAPGIGWFVWKSAGDMKNAWLEKNGQRIQAEITGVAPDTSLTVNGAHRSIVNGWIRRATRCMFFRAATFGSIRRVTSRGRRWTCWWIRTRSEQAAPLRRGDFVPAEGSLSGYNMRDHARLLEAQGWICGRNCCRWIDRVPRRLRGRT